MTTPTARAKPKIVISGILILVLILLCFGLFMFWGRKEFIYLGRGHFIYFYNHYYKIDSCSREFRISKELLDTIYDGCFVQFCDEPESNEYEVIQAENGSLIGVLDHAYGEDRLFLMYDFSPNLAWPCYPSTDEVRDALFNRLRSEHPGLSRPKYWDSSNQ